MPVDDKTTAYAHPAESTRVVSSDRTGTGVEQTTIVDEAAEEALKTRGAAVNLLAVAGTYDKALGATMRAAVRDDPTLLADHIAIFNHLTSDPVTKMQVMEALAKGKAELTGTQASFFEESLDRVSSDSAYPNVKANFSSDVNALFQSAHADPTSLFDPSMARTPETKTPVERFGPSM
jgi:hypothetical protein